MSTADNPDLEDDDRIKITGEVFTPPKLVNEMLAKLPAPGPDRRQPLAHQCT